MNRHCSNIRMKTKKPVAAHFYQSDHSMEVRGISMMTTHRGEERESFWIFTPRTLAPDKMNLGE